MKSTEKNATVDNTDNTTEINKSKVISDSWSKSSNTVVAPERVTNENTNTDIRLQIISHQKDRVT